MGRVVCPTHLSRLGFVMPTTVNFTTPGQSFWTCPNDVAFANEMSAKGGGGSGTRRRIVTAGGGGGGGATAKSTGITLYPGHIYEIYVASGGSGNFGSQEPGQSSYIKDPWGVSIVLAVGGGAPSVQTNPTDISTGGQGGQAASCIGQQKFSGGNGADGGQGCGGGGGSGAGDSANGNNDTNTGAPGGSDPGATAPSGGGNGGTGYSSIAGSNGQQTGGGGGGTAQNNANGGNGGNGKVSITYSTSAEIGSPFNAAGTSTVSNPGHKLTASPFSSNGSSVVSNPGNINRQSAFLSSGIASAANPGAHKFASAFVAAGFAIVENPGNSLARSSFNAAGTSTAIMVGAGNNASSFSSNNSSSANMIGASVAESSFNSNGLSFAAMFSPSIASSAFSSSGSSLARMYSPTLTIVTLQDGSGGNPDGGATIDWTICDFANINLTAGVGSFPIDHINLIAGKKISVHVHNNVGATGMILWDGGDAPVNWIGLPTPPIMPANGETLHVEFECNEDRTEILGRLFVDEEIRELLAGLDQRYGRTLFDHFTSVGNVGTSETTLYQDVIAGGVLSRDGDKILAEYAIEFATSINAKQILIYFPTTVVIFDTGSLAITATTDCELRATIIRKTASTARAVVTITTLPVAVGGGNSQITDEATLTGLNFDLDLTMKLAAVGGATDDVVAKLGYGEFKPAAV